MAGIINKKNAGTAGTRIEVDPKYAGSLLAQVIALTKARQSVKEEGQSGWEAEGWESWLREFFPTYITNREGEVNFASFHREFWSWAWPIRRGQRPPPFVAIWPRGAAKSTSVELAVAAWAALNSRKYILYVSMTQEQADTHVGNVAGMLENTRLGRAYPDIGERAVGKFGNIKGWRRNRIRAASGLTVDAIGLDTAARGIKVDEDRPDAIVFDDIDDQNDSMAAVEKKIRTITTKLVPAGAEDCIFLFLQNLIHPNSVASQLVNGKADFFHGRIVSGPFPALQDPVIELDPEDPAGQRYVVLSGTPTWDGMSMFRVQEMLDDMGYTAFMAECQHDVSAPAGGMFNHLKYRHAYWMEDDPHALPTGVPKGAQTVPDLKEVVVWCDPAVSDTDMSDAHGITVAGLGVDDKVYILWSWEQRVTPTLTLRLAILKALEYGSKYVGVEKNNGGDLWRSQYEDVWDQMVRDEQIPPDNLWVLRGKRLPFRDFWASGQKAVRVSKLLIPYEQGRIFHVVNSDKSHVVLEASLNRFPKTKPFDLADSEATAVSQVLGLGKWAGWGKHLKAAQAASTAPLEASPEGSGDLPPMAPEPEMPIPEGRKTRAEKYAELRAEKAKEEVLY